MPTYSGVNRDGTVPLGSLAINDKFRMKDGSHEGVLTGLNEAEAIVTIYKQGEPPRRLGWSLATAVMRVNEFEAEKPSALTCPNCGKVCTSKSGYTLHSQTCEKRKSEP